MPGQVPLTNDEKEWLLTVYKLRRQYLFSSCYIPYMILLAGSYILLHIMFLIATVSGIYSDRLLSWQDYLFAWWGIKLALLLLLPAIICRLAYNYWIAPLKADALSGIKEKTEFIVTNKDPIPAIGRYFIRINNGTNYKYGVTEDKYNSCEEGSPVVMYQAIQSGYIFSENHHAKVKLVPVLGSAWTGDGYEE